MAKKKYVFKILVAGQGGVGKTTLLNRAVTGKFVQNTAMTIGVEFHLLSFVLGKPDDEAGLNVVLQLWDFGGQERFRFMLDSYVAGARGVLLLYDLTRLRTLDGLEEWVTIVRKHDKNIPILFVGTKLDRVEDITVADDYAQEFMEPLHMFGHMKISSKDGTGVKDAFKTISRKILEMNGVPLPEEVFDTKIVIASDTNIPDSSEQSPSIVASKAPVDTATVAKPAPFTVPKTKTSSPFGLPKVEKPTPFSAPKPDTSKPFGLPKVEKLAPFTVPKSETSAPFGLPKVEKPAPFSAPKPETSKPFGLPKVEKPATPFTFEKPKEFTSSIPPNSESQTSEKAKTDEEKRKIAKKKEEDSRLSDFFS
jgi:small GTP-binding protein